MARSVEKIRQKFGKNAFREWGKEGGNELLIAQGRGAKITIHREQVSRSAPHRIIREKSRRSKHRATQI